jgi:hypothetical protein
MIRHQPSTDMRELAEDSPTDLSNDGVRARWLACMDHVTTTTTMWCGWDGDIGRLVGELNMGGVGI